MKPGNELTIDFDVESREHNGRWHTDVKAWKIEAEDITPGELPVTYVLPGSNTVNENDGLPF